MARNPSCTVYVGNLDEKVTDRILYEILIQVGRVADLYLPCDKETNRHKGYAFVEYETEEIANYAVRLFSGVVRLYNRTLKFAISGQYKNVQNTGTSVTPKANTILIPKSHPEHGREVLRDSALPTDSRVTAYTKPSENTCTPMTPKVHSTLPKPHPMYGREVFQSSAQSSHSKVSVYTHSATQVTPRPYTPYPPHVREMSTLHDSPHSAIQVTPRPYTPYPPHVREMSILHDSPHSANCRVAAYAHSLSPGYPQASAHGFVDNGVISSNFDCTRQVFGSTAINVNRSGSCHPILCPSFLQQS